MFFLKVFIPVYVKISPSRMDVVAPVEESAGCAPKALPASRLDMELRDIDKWQEAIQLKEATLKLCRSVPRPLYAINLCRSVPRPLNANTRCALEDVQNFLEDFSEIANAPSSRPLKVATTAVLLVVKASFTQSGLPVDLPAACKQYRAKNCAEALKVIQGLEAPPQVPGVDHGQDGSPSEQPPTGAVLVLHHLVEVQRAASAIIHRTVATMPLVSCSLSEDMIADKAAHAVFFKAASAITAAYDQLFRDQKGDVKSLWANHVSSAGRLSHPARHTPDSHIFDGQLWFGSITSVKEVLRRGAALPDHPLPDAATLMMCFKHHVVRSSYDNRKRHRAADYDDNSKMYYIDSDVVKAIALIIGDICYKLTLHLGNFTQI